MFEMLSAVISSNYSFLPLFSFWDTHYLIFPFLIELDSSIEFLSLFYLTFLFLSTGIISRFLPLSQLTLFSIWSALFPVLSIVFLISLIQLFGSRIISVWCFFRVSTSLVKHSLCLLIVSWVHGTAFLSFLVAWIST